MKGAIGPIYNTCTGGLVTRVFSRWAMFVAKNSFGQGRAPINFSYDRRAGFTCERDVFEPLKKGTSQAQPLLCREEGHLRLTIQK